MARLSAGEWSLIAQGLRALWDAAITKSMNQRDAALEQQYRRTAERALALAERIERATTASLREVKR
jgi:hypothetical protein